MIKLRYNLWKMKRGLRPDDRFKESLRQELDRAWQTRYGSVPWFQMAWFRYAAAPAMALVLVVFAGTSAYAYTSPEVVEGNLLYPIKTVVEKVEETLSVTPAMKTKYYIRQLDRRYQEAAVVEKKVKKQTVQKTVEAQAKIVEKIGQVEKKLVEQKQVLPSNTKNQIKLRADIQAALKESEVKKRLITVPTTNLKLPNSDLIRKKLEEIKRVEERKEEVKRSDVKVGTTTIRVKPITTSTLPVIKRYPTPVYKMPTTTVKTPSTTLIKSVPTSTVITSPALIKITPTTTVFTPSTTLSVPTPVVRPTTTFYRTY